VPQDLQVDYANAKERKHDDNPSLMHVKDDYEFCVVHAAGGPQKRFAEFPEACLTGAYE
jgi:hypothetical protein